jgi:hypothetical protein
VDGPESSEPEPEELEGPESSPETSSLPERRPPWSSFRSSIARDGLGFGGFAESETGWAESPISRPEIAFAASAIAPAATIPVTPSKRVSIRSLVVMGSP